MTEPSIRSQVLVVGAGCMGRPIAQRLLELGWKLAVVDVLASARAFFTDYSPLVTEFIEFIATKKIVALICVVNAAQVDAVFFGTADSEQESHHGLARRMQAGSCAIICSTISPEQMKSIAHRLAGFGIHTIDAPMSGGPVRARSGEMSLMVAAREDVLVEHAALLSAMSTKLHTVSHRVGDASKLKLVNNLLAATNLHAAASALALAWQLGLDARTTQAVINASSGQSWIGQDRMGRLLAGDDQVHAQIALLAKGTALALAMCADAGLVAPWGHLSADAFSRACAQGRATADDSTLAN